MSKSKIEWTEQTWNPAIGCNKVSAGCKNCYAETMAKRLQSMGNLDYIDGFKFKILPQRLNQPFEIKGSKLFFVNSMSDLFHEQMPKYYLDKIFDVIKRTPQHFYQILTKRPLQMYNYCSEISIPGNAILGVSIENKRAIKRKEFLLDLDCKKFLSIEPLLENLENIELKGIDWVIVGGESGTRARPMHKDWVINIFNICKKDNIPFFFKQWGTYGSDGIKRNKLRNGRILFNKSWNEKPKFLVKEEN